MDSSALSIQSLIKEIGRGARGARDLETDAARHLYAAMLDGRVEDLQLGAIALALRVKGESVGELDGFAQALAARTTPLDLPPGTVLLPTLNGGRKLLNAMPLLALWLARQGVPVLIHGRYDFGEVRQDPFALLAALGLKPCADAREAEQALAARRIALLPTAVLSPGLDRLMALRPRLGLRNSAHTLAKLIDPAPGRSVRVAALTHGDFLERLAVLLPLQGGRQGGAAMLLKGCEGEAYPHARRAPSLQAWQGEQALTLELGVAEEAPLWDSLGDPATDAAALIGHLEAGPETWPARLREMALTLHMLSRNI